MPILRDMSVRLSIAMLAMVAVMALLADVPSACAQPHEQPYGIFPEQRQIEYRCPHQFCRLPIPGIPRPPTVRDPQDSRQVVYVSLDEAIRMSLANTEVIRVLNGLTASSTGRSIYDPAISNTRIDAERAEFDPRISIDNTAVINGNGTTDYNLGIGLTAARPRGGTASLQADDSSMGSIGFSQPLLQGAGLRRNLAPIVIARINTEISYFQFKDAIQELVRSIIDGYWGLVFARTELWARKQQIEQADFALKQIEAQKAVGRADLGDTAQALSLIHI